MKINPKHEVEVEVWVKEILRIEHVRCRHKILAKHI